MKAKANEDWRWRRPPFSYPATAGPTLYYRYSHDIANVLGLRVAGYYAVDGKVKWKPWPALASLAAISSPLALAAMDSCVHPVPAAQQGAYVGWLSYFAALAVVATVFSRIGVETFHRLTPYLEDALTEDGRLAYDRWSDVSTSLLPQALAGVVTAVAAVVALLLTSGIPGIGTELYVSIASYWSLAVTGFYISGGPYWILAGTILSVPLTEPRRMQLNQYSPSLTPGLELLARCYNLAFVLCALGVSLVLIPMLSWAYSAPSSPMVFWIKGFLFVAGFGAVVTVALVPQYRLSHAVAESRRAELTRVTSALARNQASPAKEDASQAVLLTQLQTLTASPPATVASSTIVAVIVGLLSVAFPYVIQFMLGASGK